MAGAALTASIPTASNAAPARKTKMKLGVSTYCYHPEIRALKMTFEDVLKDISDMGAEGVEFLGEGCPPDYPNPSAEWVAHYFSMLDRLNLKPSAYATHLDTTMYRDRWLTTTEAAELMEVDFKLAHMLGFKTLRQHVVPYPADNRADDPEYPYVRSKLSAETIMKALPAAEKYDTRMAIELHSPTRLQSDFVKMIVEIIEKTKTKHLGLTIDFSAFLRRPRRDRLEQLYQQGARKNILEYIVEAYAKKVGPAKTVEEVKKMGGNEVEILYAGVAGIYHASNNEPKELIPFLPYIYHVHAKFHEITDDLKEYSIPYEEILPILDAGGYDGYLSSEYEGPRDKFTISAVLRAQHDMMRKMLGMV
jgi:sugar phosphate isomerase/epimerase